MLENYLVTLEDCRFCLMCRHVAPVGLITRQETLTPHGIALIVTSQRRGLQEWNPETAGVVFSEVDGGNSRAHCVNDRPFEAAVATVRAYLAAQELAPASVYEARDKIARWGSAFGEPVEPAVKSQDVALFVGDAPYHLQKGTLPAVEQLLGALGIDAAQIGAGRDSGFLTQSMGFPDLAKQLAEKTLSELKATGAQLLLVLSAGDFFTFNQMYAERLDQSWPAGVAIMELTSYLAEQVAAGALSFVRSNDTTPYAYVDPTHAVRVPSRHEHPRALLKAVMAAEPLELFWRRDRAQPVGDTHLQFSRPELAERLTRARLEDAVNIGAELLICDDAATLYQLDRFASEYGLRVQGLYELLSDALPNHR